MKEFTSTEVYNGGYDEIRGQLIKTVNLKEYIDHPFLFLSRQRFTDYLTRIKLFEKIIHVKGSVVECGVHKGSSLMLYYHLSTILEPYAFNRKIIGFDSFVGFRSISEKDPPYIDESNFSDTSLELLEQVISLNDLNRPIPQVSKTVLVNGDATETIPKYVEANPHLIVALLYLDFDIYEPTKTALEYLLPLVPKGGIVAFDEAGAEKWPGETEALKECLDLNSITLQKYSFDPWVSFFVVGE